MKRMWKKAAVLLMTLAMVLAMGITAGAVSIATGTGDVVTNLASVEITGVPTDSTVTYTTYQVLYATYDSGQNELTWHLTDWATAALVGVAGSGKLYTTEAAAIPGIIAISTTGATTTEQDEIVNTLAAYVAQNSGSVSAYTDANWTLSGTTSSATLPVGSYLVLPSASDMSFLNMLVSVSAEGDGSGWTIKANGAVLKGKQIGITKQVSDDISNASAPGYGDDASVGIGDTVYYAITADVPQFPANSTTYEFKVTDTPVNVSIDLSSVNVYGINSSDEKIELTSVSNYTASKDSISGVLTVDFSTQYLTTFYSSGAYPYKSVYITYSAEVLSTAVIEDGNENTAKLSYGSSYTSTVSAKEDEGKTKVYTYAAVLTKYDDNSSSPATLANATFNVSYNNTVLSFVVDSSSTDAHKVYRVADSDDTNTTTDIITGTDGLLTIIGLDAGKEYKVVETKAPSGYSLNTNYIKFTIVAAKNGTSGDLTGDVDSVTSKEYTSGDVEVSGGNTWSAAATDATHTSANAYMYMSVTDTELSALPATGSIGIIVFTIAGVIIMILALVLINSGKSKAKKA